MSMLTSYVLWRHTFFGVLDFSFKMDDDFDDYGSDISLYEESDGENDQDLNPTELELLELEL